MMRYGYWSYRVGGLLLMACPCVSMAQATGQGSPASGPAVELPVIQATAPNTVSNNAVPPAGNAEPVQSPVNVASLQANKYSYGDAAYSLLFTPDQIEAMKSALRTYESVQQTDQGAGEVAVTVSAPAQAPTIYEPSMYPVFYLSSVVYRNAHDWTVWVKESPAAGGASAPPLPMATPSSAGNFVPPAPAAAADATFSKNDPSLIRITPKLNNRDIKVVHISANQVEFSWHPSAYTQAISTRYSKKLFTPIDAVKHRIALNTNVSFDTQKQTVHFSLKQNQSFSAAYSQSFEGNIDPVPLAPLSGANAAPAANIPMSPQAASDINGLLGQPATANGTATPGAAATSQATSPTTKPANAAPNPSVAPAPVTPTSTPTAPMPTVSPAPPNPAATVQPTTPRP